MSSLEDYQPLTETISFEGRAGKASIEVRGIGTEDLIRIFTDELPAVSTAYALWQSTKAKKFSEIGFITNLVTKAPGLVAEIISLAADQHTEKAKAGVAKLPFGVQVGAMEAIYRLTLQDVGGLKNLLAILGYNSAALAGVTLPGLLRQGQPAALN